LASNDIVEKDQLDPWGSTAVKDYNRLQTEFGIESISTVLSRFKRLSIHLSRGIDFGHRDLGRILDAIDSGKPYAVMSGIKPTGVFHLGNKMTADDMVYFQSLSKKAIVYYAVADVEAYCDNGITFKDSKKIALQNVADVLALGLDPARAVVYMQSEEVRVMRFGAMFSRSVTINTLKAIYGDKQVGLYFSALIQAGDILMPQLREFGGPKPVIVPVGADQDPHIRLCRDLAVKYSDEFGFISPSAIYHKLMLSLSGDSKMSKRVSSSSITLEDQPAAAARKVLTAFTGGRATVEEQRRLGGEADKCPVYDLYRFHFALNDEHSQRVYDECIGGVRMCGDCKKEAAGLVKAFLEEHQKKRRALEKDAQELLAKSKDALSSRGS
jgi:tryptophanyl-tRNA synthetase